MAQQLNYRLALSKNSQSCWVSTIVVKSSDATSTGRTKPPAERLEACPECRRKFDGESCCPIQEACGHIKCRHCFIQAVHNPFIPFANPDICSQCDGSDIPLPARTKAMQIRTDKIIPDSPAVASSNPTAKDYRKFPVSINSHSAAVFESTKIKKDYENLKIKTKAKLCMPESITIIGCDPILYKCTPCNKTFRTKAHVKYHTFCRDPSNSDSDALIKKPFQCKECGRGFVAKSHFQYHLRTHTGEKPYPCTICGKRFNQQGKVTRHMKVHTGEKSFSCQQCGKRFSTVQTLRTHFQIHSGERPFACQYCTRRFTTMTNLNKHVITHTGEKPFSCKVCGKSFGLKWTLQLHHRRHLAVRPHKCDQCSRTFTTAKDLNRHVVIHSGERPFKCSICKSDFTRKDNLIRHVTGRHQNECNVLSINYCNDKNNTKLLLPIPLPERTEKITLSDHGLQIQENVFETQTLDEHKKQ